MAREIQRRRCGGVDASLVADGLHVGSRPKLSLCTDRWDVVVLCSRQWQPLAPTWLEVIRAPIDDGLVTATAAVAVEGAAAAIVALPPGHRVLVTCRAGFNRSGLVAARVLMLRGATAAEAIGKVRDSRGVMALGNHWFVEYLHCGHTNLEQKL